jgi:hypothetical protein
MAKTFITERDVDDLKARGITSIDVTDNVVMTDLAIERAFKHGIKVVRAEHSPAPTASFSPSVNTLNYKVIDRTPSAGAMPIQSKPSASDAEIIAKVKAAVLAKLDGQVDEALLDAVITKIVTAMK